MAVRLKRAYEPPSPDDGLRYLVERLWPRGLTKESLALNGWLKDIAPSTELRRWYGHDTRRWAEFSRRDLQELRAPDRREALETLAGAARSAVVTLVFAARDPEHSSAHVLRDFLEARDEASS